MERIRNFYQTYHPIVHTLFLGTMLARTASAMSMPFLALYLGHRTQLSPTMIGLTIGAGSLAGTFGGFFGGALSDRFGRKKVMMTSLYTWGVVMGCFGLVSSSWLFLLLNVLNGLCRSFFEPVSQALMGDLTVPEKRLRMFALRYTAVNMGVAVGPLIGALFGMVAGGTPFLVTGAIYMVYAVTLHTLLNRFGINQIEGQKREQVTIRAAGRVIVRDVALQFFLLGGILNTLGYSQMTVTLTEYVEKNFVDGITLVAWLVSTNAVVVILCQLPVSRWSEKRTPYQCIAIGNCLYALGDVGFAFAHSWTTMIIAMVIFSMGEILCFPAGSVFIDRLAPEGLRGTYFGAQNFKNIGQFLGPWIGGLLMTSYGAAPMFLIVGGVSLVSTMFYAMGQRQSGGRVVRDSLDV
jgi:MFS family permease